MTFTTTIGERSSALSAPSTRPNPPTSSFGTSFAGGPARSRASIAFTRDCDAGRCEQGQAGPIGRRYVALSRASPASTEPSPARRSAIAIGRWREKLRHLRALGIDVHRPLTLRLLHDAKRKQRRGRGVMMFSPRFSRESVRGRPACGWLSGRWPGGTRPRPSSPMERGPGAGEDYVEYWLGRIQRLRNTRVGSAERRGGPERASEPGRPTEGARPDPRLRSSAN